LEATGELTIVNIGTASATDIFDVTVTNNAPSAYGVGTTPVTWTAVDSNGNQTQKVQMITIVDTTAPTFDLTILKDELWAPHHKLVLAAIVENVNDLVDSAPVVDIEVTSNGDHKHKHKFDHKDYKIVKNGSVWEIWLRAEKLFRNKEDRVYTINVSVSDASGNVATDAGEVIVPRSHKKAKGKHKDHKSDSKHAKKHDHDDKRDNNFKRAKFDKHDDHKKGRKHGHDRK
jgi:hypothetical protein